MLFTRTRSPNFGTNDSNNGVVRPASPVKRFASMCLAATVNALVSACSSSWPAAQSLDPKLLKDIVDCLVRTTLTSDVSIKRPCGTYIRFRGGARVLLLCLKTTLWRHCLKWKCDVRILAWCLDNGDRIYPSRD